MKKLRQRHKTVKPKSTPPPREDVFARSIFNEGIRIFVDGTDLDGRFELIEKLAKHMCDDALELERLKKPNDRVFIIGALLQCCCLVAKKKSKV